MSAKKEVIVDTSGFFAGARKLRSLVEAGTKLATMDLVVFEFIKVIMDEINRAESSRRSQRLKVLNGLKARFPGLLRSLEVNLLAPGFTLEDLDWLYVESRDGVDPGDAMIWLKMQRAGLDTIVTDNVADWQKLGANVISIR